MRREDRGPVISPRPSRSAPARWLRRLVGVLLAWLVGAYLILPWLWRRHERHPGLEGVPTVTRTAEGLPGDPLNVGLIGRESALVGAMLAAGWRPADPITLRSSLRIAADVLEDRPYPDAPVSNLYLFGRRQDLAFEKPAGVSPRRRHHVRFWRADGPGRPGAPLWVGAATFDRGVGLSHRTGQITHHIDPAIDRERDALIGDLVRAGRVAELSQAPGVGPTLFGRNGGGDWYSTDGEMTVGVLGEDAPAAPERR